MDVLTMSNAVVVHEKQIYQTLKNQIPRFFSQIYLNMKNKF